MQYYLYILANPTNTVLYIGITNDLVKRVTIHKSRVLSGFTSKYNVSKLVYFEIGADIEEVIKREKQLKGGSRKKKVDLIIKDNPQWRDLFDDLQG